MLDVVGTIVATVLPAGCLSVFEKIEELHIDVMRILKRPRECR